MKDKQTLATILRSIYTPRRDYAAIPDLELYKELSQTVGRFLYKNEMFKEFLDTQTNFLPDGTPSKERWKYYSHGETKPHLCPTCNKFIQKYELEFCSRPCSDKADRTGRKKTGPKPNPEAKEKWLKQAILDRRPGYSVVTYGETTSVFKHLCGRQFEATNATMSCPLRGNRSRFSKYCDCQKVKAYKVTLENLKRRFAIINTPWQPVSYTEGDINGVFKHADCGHHCELPVRHAYVLTRCNICHQNPMSQGYTDKSYVRWLKENKPDFELVGKYTDGRVYTEYRHKSCGKTFSTKPTLLQKPSYRCPECSQKLGGMPYDVTYNGITFKVRGKEGIALEWMFKNTSITPDRVKHDLSGNVPSISYISPANKKTRTYKPDFLIDKKLLLEVKSPTTLGLRYNYYGNDVVDLWYNNCAKAKACLRKGYKFILMVFDANNNLVKIPRYWYEYTHDEITDWYNDRVPVPVPIKDNTNVSYNPVKHWIDDKHWY